MARPPKITNEEILTAARQVFLEEGFGASTLAIAEKAGISEASIFKRFGTKEGLFIEAMGVFDTPQWVKNLSNQQPTADIKSELTEICKQMLALYQVILPRVFMVMSRGNIPIPPPAPPPPHTRSHSTMSIVPCTRRLAWRAHLDGAAVSAGGVRSVFP